MDSPLPHEEPLCIVLPRGTSAGSALRRFLARPEVKAYAFPEPWFLEPAGVDLLAALPDVRAFTPENLDRVLDAAVRVCTPDALAERSAQLWREADERVRQYFLKRGTLGVLAGIFRMGPKTVEVPPPAEFVADRVHEHRFEVQYRLARDRGEGVFPAPPEEGSVVVYPFDPENRAARAQHGLGSDVGPILEVFAYVWQHDRHRALWASVAADLGARLL
jgi:hypothetical protein